MSRLSFAAVLVIALGAAALSPGSVSAKRARSPKPSLSAAGYAFSVVGTALLAPQGSGMPSLVPAAISGTIVFTPDGSFTGIANVDIGGLACNAGGPGGVGTGVAGTVVLFAPTPYAVGGLSVSTSGGPPGLMFPSCVDISFLGPVTGSPTGAAGFVLTGDPDSSHLNISLQYGIGTIQGQAVTDLTAIGWATQVPAATGTGGEEP